MLRSSVLIKRFKPDSIQKYGMSEIINTVTNENTHRTTTLLMNSDIDNWQFFLAKNKVTRNIKIVYRINTMYNEYSG